MTVDPTLLVQPSIRADPRSRAFAQLLERLGEIDLEPLLVYKISTTVPSALPWLAEQFNVGGLKGWAWQRHEEEERQLIRNAVPLHRLKGTVEGYQTMARITKRAELRSYIAPPDMPFLSRQMTQAEWEFFLAQMPQIRTYRWRSRGNHYGAMFGDFYYQPADEDLDKDSLPYLSDAIQRFRERAFLWRPSDNSETELIVYDREEVAQDGFSTTIKEMAEPGEPIGLFFLDHGDFEVEGLDPSFVGHRSVKGHPFLVDHDARSRIYTLEFDTPYAVPTDGFGRRLVAPGFEQLRVKFDAIAEAGSEVGLHWGGMWFADSNPPIQLQPPAETGPQVRIPWRLSLNFGSDSLAIEGAEEP